MSRPFVPPAARAGWSSAASLRFTLAYYALGVVLMQVYGVEVCPFLESLSAATFFGMLVAAFALAAAARAALQPAFVDRAPLLERAGRQAALELALYAGVGLTLSLFDMVAFGFPLASGLKLLVGCVTLGLFASLDAGLWRQRAEWAQLAHEAAPLTATASVTRRLMVAFAAVLALSGGVILLAVAKDVNWVLDPDTRATPQLIRRLILTDVVFTLAVIMALGYRVLRSFSANLQLLLDAQVDTLAHVQDGRYDLHVPVTTNDEFAVIADRTNRMIDGLREKERIQGMLGKVVSPAVARKLLETPAEALRGGQRMDVAVLFCDLRDFTALSERVRPEQVVELLNAYFTEMVGCIERENGLVDKFIGDAILAVFGLDASPDPCASAVRAGRAMVERAASITRPDGAPLANGLGIHFGPAVAGAIGAPQRYEYTVIGDTVNAASRIESLCKSLGARMLVSAEVLRHLPPELAATLSPRGSHMVKGKEAALELYGI